MSLTLSKEKIVSEIKLFYELHQRIPFKNEFTHATAARKRFTTWNNAIIAAGFNPNPLKFAKKYFAKDKHKCDSFAEMIIDDWLNAKDILHERNVPYGKNQMTADFKVNDKLIEFIGLQGVRKYDDALKRKEKFIKQKKLQIIKIYPKDLFPINRLSTLLNFS